MVFNFPSGQTLTPVAGIWRDPVQIGTEKVRYRQPQHCLGENRPGHYSVVWAWSNRLRLPTTPFSMLQYLTIPVTPFAQNCSLLWCDQTQKAAVIDPGGDLDQVLAEAKRLGLSLEQIWLTHAHIDHAGGTGELAQRLGLPIVGPHEADQFWIDALPQQSQMFGFPPAQAFVPTRWLHDGDTVSVGLCELKVRHCPGHTPGHVVFYSEQAKRAFVGDVLFAGSIGRTDFPRGDHATLIESIRQRLWPMGNDTVFIPGHGPESTFGRERRSNPFVADGR